MIAVKDAVKIAISHFTELFPNAKEVRLEEVQMSEMGPWWEITLSFASPPGTSAFEIITAAGQRQYKVVSVDRETGELHSITIRTL